LLSIIYPYRNKDLERLKRSFNSLSRQTNKNLNVYVIDYGSNIELSKEMDMLCQQYDFITYKYNYTQFQPWNKSRALNTVIKELDSKFCFVADADIIFHSSFVEIAQELMKFNRTTYFQVGYLNQSESKRDTVFEGYKDYRLSNEEATGLSLFPVDQLKQLNGFDEFYHFWGAEDTDMHIRLKNAGYEVQFYDEKLLLLHQWHESFQRRQKRNSIKALRLSGILPLNHQHLKNAMTNRVTKVNLSGWGQTLESNKMDLLDKTKVGFYVTFEKRQVDDILFGQLPTKKSGVVKVKFIPDPFKGSRKYKIKRFLGKKVPDYYTLQEVKDRILLHLISFYRDLPYTIKIDEYGGIEVAIEFS
jgi:glycosyltransferase involved in cell wall biosynthesis